MSTIDETDDPPIAAGTFWLFAPRATLVATCALVSLIARASYDKIVLVSAQ